MSNPNPHAIEKCTETCEMEQDHQAPARPENRPVYRPRVDILETGNEFIAQMDIPGARPDSIDVEFERGTLTISAEVDAPVAVENRRCVLREYGTGDYERSFTLTDEVAADRISAEYRDGVLTLTLPKTDNVKPRKVPVTSD